MAMIVLELDHKNANAVFSVLQINMEEIYLVKTDGWEKISYDRYVEIKNSNEKWYIQFEKNGKLHRENGPAIENSKGLMAWCIDGKFHNERGPAVIHPGGKLEWWVNGKRLKKEKVERIGYGRETNKNT